MNDSVIITALVGLVCALVGFLFRTLLSDRDKRIETLETSSQTFSKEFVSWQLELNTIKEKLTQYIRLIEKMEEKIDRFIEHREKTNDEDC
jgi:hypothetical protein